MGNLVRLCDYMLTHALAQHAIDTSMALHSSLQPTGSSRVGHPPHTVGQTNLSQLSRLQSTLALLVKVWKIEHLRSQVVYVIQRRVDARTC